MCTHYDKTTLSPASDFDHYKLEPPTKMDYVGAMPDPTYFDYTSAVTKPHILRNPYLVPEILVSRDGARFMSGWDQHYKPVLGELTHHIIREVMGYILNDALNKAE